METGKLRYFFKIGIALSATSIIFHIITFVSNGWGNYKLSNETWHVGMWYFTKCNENGECETKSRRDQFEEYQSISTMVSYSNIVRWQVVETIALCCSILCAVMFAVGLYKRCYVRRIRIIILICSTLSGSLLLHDLGFNLGEIPLLVKQVEDYPYDSAVYFPWSCLTQFFAVLPILAVPCLCLITEWRMSRSGNQQETAVQQGATQFHQSRKLTILCILMNSVSIAFRIVAFSSNAWRITKSGFYTTYYGLWFLSKCRESDGCETMSMRTYYKDTPNRGLDSYDYILQVRSQVVETLCLVLSMVCLLLLLVESRKTHSHSLMRISILLTALLSGTFWLYDVAHYMRIFVIDMENKSDYRTVYFPWSILSALLGTLLILTFSFIRFVQEYKITDMDHSELENIFAMNLATGSISSGNTESELGVKNVVTTMKG